MSEENEKLVAEDNLAASSGELEADATVKQTADTASSELTLSDEELLEVIFANNSLVAGPWVVWDDGDIGTGYSVEKKLRNRRSKEVETVTVESDWLFNSSTGVSDHVVTLRNHMPALLSRLIRAEDELISARQEIERLKESL